MNFKFTILALLFAFTFESLSFAQNTIIFSAKNKIELIGKQTEIFEDSEGVLLIKDITSEKFAGKFKKSSGDDMNFGATKSAIWLRFTIKNQSARDVLLDLGNSVIQDVEFYIPRGDGEFIKIKTGTLQPFYSREFNLNTFLFKILPQEITYEKTFYLRLKSEHPLEVPLKIGTIEEFLHYYHRIDLFYGFYFGLMIVMFLYNFFVYWSVRDSIYLYYIAYLLGAMLINAFLLGNYAFEFLWYNFESFNSYFIFWSGFTPIFGIIFSSKFLHLDEYAPFIHKLILSFLIFIVGFQIANLAGYYGEIIEVYQSAISLPTLVLLVTAFYIYRKGYQPALLFFAGWFVYICGIVVFVLATRNILPGTFVFKNAVIVGQEMEVVIFAFALGAKINQLRKEHALAREEALKQAKENERIVREQNEILETKVKERTFELAEKNEMLEERNQEIISQQHELLAINEKLSSQYNEIEEINQVIDMTYRQLRSSIEYAKNIQNALLPFEGRIALSLKEYFILYRPKDIVSGDFYWVQDLAIKKFAKESDSKQTISESELKKSKVIIAVADCTGHGVPGAFMSMIGNELLSQIVNINNTTSPEEILYQLHLGIRFALRQDETSSRDGMDISICVWDKEKNIIEYAGAMNPLYYVKNGEFFTVKADKTPIGGYQKEAERRFKKHIIELDVPTTFYMCTDGFQDQFGGDFDRKFISKNLRALLHKISDKNLATQKHILNDTLDTWKGNRKQTDDVTIFGFKL